MKHGFVYLMKCNEFYKVGISRNPHQRIIELQTGNPYTLELVECYACQDELSVIAERKIHDFFSSSRVRGEWFFLDENQLQDIKNSLAIFVLDTGKIPTLAKDPK